MKHSLFVFCLLEVFIGLCYSCKKETSSKCPILLTVDSLMWMNPDTALLLLEQFPVPQDLKGADRAFYALLMTQARYKTCKSLENDSLIKIAVDYYKGTKDKEKLAESHFYWGCVYREKKQLPRAIELYLKAVDVMSQENDSIFLAMAYSHLGDCYREEDLNQTAISMYKKGYRLCVKQDSVRACYALKDIGDSFLMEYRLDSVHYYYSEALKLAFHLQNQHLIALLYKNLAALYNEEGKYVEAETCISKALPHLSGEEDYTSACSAKGDIMSNLNQNDSAVYYWNIGKESSNIYTKTSSYYCLYQESKARGRWKESTLYADSFFIFYDSIQTMNDRAELDKLMDNHLVELHKYKLSVKNKQFIGVVIAIFLLLVLTVSIIYLWRDRRWKKRYILLQQRLMEKRAEIMLLNELPESVLDTKRSELHKLAEERFSICISLFKTTEGYKRISEYTRATPKMRIGFINAHRQVIVNDVRNTFADVMGDLKDYCSTLTNDDLFYCMLSLLHCPKDAILDIMDVSSDAIKTRKNRIKNKIDIDLFNRIFGY